MATPQEQMVQARDLIGQKRYKDARSILNTVNHPKAREWLAKLDEIELGDPFASDRHAVIQIAATQKSYTNAAVIVLVLYCLLWIPGVIANILYLNEAKQDEAKANHSLPGVQALRYLQALFTTTPIILGSLAALLLAFFAFSEYQATNEFYRQNETRILTTFKSVCKSDFTKPTDARCEEYAQSILKARINKIYMGAYLDAYDRGDRDGMRLWQDIGNIPFP